MTILIVLSLGVGSLLWFSLGGLIGKRNLGSVSAEWLSEYRQNHES
jgi:hypothetical protein